MLKKQEDVGLELRNEDGLQGCYGSRVCVSVRVPEDGRGDGITQEKEAICLALNNRDGLANSYGNQALALKAWGNWKKGWHYLGKRK